MPEREPTNVWTADAAPPIFSKLKLHLMSRSVFGALTDKVKKQRRSDNRPRKRVISEVASADAAPHLRLTKAAQRASPIRAQ